MLEASPGRLVDLYDLLMFDLDGVVYVGDDAVPGAPEHLARARAEGAHVAFITNNASRPPQAVADKLTGLGVQAEASDVVTSAQAAAHVLLERHGVGARARGPPWRRSPRQRLGDRPGAAYRPRRPRAAVAVRPARPALPDRPRRARQHRCSAAPSRGRQRAGRGRPVRQRGEADRLAGRIARELDATYALRLGAPDPRHGFLPLPNAGPILTWRALADHGPPPLPNWKLRLGDVELF